MGTLDSRRRRTARFARWVGSALLAMVVAVGVMSTAEAADTGFLQVDTVDAATGQPMPGVDVTAYGDLFDYDATTNAGGSIVMSVEVGDYDVSGYFFDTDTGEEYAGSAEAPVTVTSGATTVVTLQMEGPPSLDCEPTSVQPAGLTNIGFESGLSGWTQAHMTEGVAVTGADDHTSPWEGASMLRIGDSQPSDEESQPEGPNVLCQDFVVDDATETFAFNVFTYDYTGFDEFHFDVVVTGADGETLASYTQGAWGPSSSTVLKTSGWRGISIDLADRMGETVRFTIRSGGTSDSAYAFWTYVDSAEASVPPSPAGAVKGATSTTGSVTTDPSTGQTTVAFPSSSPSDLTLTFEAECADEGVDPTSVSLIYGGEDYPATATASGAYTATIPGGDIAGTGSAPLSVVVNCDEETTQVIPIGQIVLYDPSGFVTNKATGKPIVGAQVSLHKVPGWVPATPATAGDPGTCQTNATKPSSGWSQPAPTGQGVLVEAASPEISPNVNPFVTNAQGYYGWDVAEGCWYVTVTKPGFLPLTSPVVGVPTAVTDLHLALTPVGPSAACLAAKAAQAAAQAALTAAKAAYAAAVAKVAAAKAKLKKAKKSGNPAKVKKAKAKYKKARKAAASAAATVGLRTAALNAAKAKVAAQC